MSKFLPSMATIGLIYEPGIFLFSLNRYLSLKKKNVDSTLACAGNALVVGVTWPAYYGVRAFVKISDVERKYTHGVGCECNICL